MNTALMPAAIAVRPRSKMLRIVEMALLAVAVLVLVAYFGMAVAGTDTTFNAATTTLTNWTTGSLGRLAAVAGIASAVAGMVFQFNWRLIAAAAGIGLTAAAGPGIVSALASATF
jgi:conjugal transfer pilus assembly protein TraA